MSNDWFRSWHGAPTDNKWLLIAKRAGVRPIHVSGTWWALLDHASQHPVRGTVEDFDVETFALFAGMEEAEVVRILEQLALAGMISNKKVVYQFYRDRDPLPPGMWRAIAARDNWSCVYCGTRNGPFEVDHIVAVANGGTHDPDNLALSCRPCNRSKGAKTLEEWLP